MRQCSGVTAIAAREVVPPDTKRAEVHQKQLPRCLLVYFGCSSCLVHAPYFGGLARRFVY